MAACRASDVCLFCLGTSAVWGAAREAARFGTLPLLSPVVEAEGWDRADLLLPGRQLSLVQAVARRTATPLAVVLLHGGPLDVEWLQRSPRVAAILTAWTPGQVCSVGRAQTRMHGLATACLLKKAASLERMTGL